MKVAYVGGFWGPNIGNAFFNLGADYVLKEIYGAENVTMVFDHPAYITQWDTKKGNPPQALDYLSHLDIDYIVLLGPVISRAFLNIWSKALIQLNKKGTGYMILSAGMMKYSEADISAVRDFFIKYPPAAFVSRDEPTYQYFRDYVPNAYSGIDFAFFLPEAYKPLKTDLQPYLTLNFDKVLEPRIKIIESRDEKNDGIIVPLNDKIDLLLKFNKIFTQTGLKTDRLTDALVYALSPLPRGKRPIEIAGYNIIRTDHRFTPMFMRKVYRYDNSFCADIPHTYANIYAQTELTLTDRVHACVATLAYGNKAMFFAKTGRSALLDRVGVKEISQKPVSVDLNILTEEKMKIIDYIKQIRL